jgi:predicted metal-dependent peptidase
MKQLLYWDDYNKYSTFTKTTGLILESQESDPLIKKVKIKVDYAIAKLGGQYKFFAELLYKLRIIYTYNLERKTAAVDGTNMFIDPNFFNGLNERQIMFVIAHEVMHCALFHFARMQGRDGFRWNVAGDYEINLLLSYDNILSYDEIAEFGLINKDYAKRNAEQLYDDSDLIMPNEPQDEEGEEGEGGEGGDGPESEDKPKKKSVLKPGDIIYDTANDMFGKVNSIDSVSKEVDFSPLSKQEAESELKKLKRN